MVAPKAHLVVEPQRVLRAVPTAAAAPRRRTVKILNEIIHPANADELRLRRTVLRLRRKVLLEQWMQICRSCLEQGLLLLPLVNRNLFYLRLLGA